MRGRPDAAGNWRTRPGRAEPTSTADRDRSDLAEAAQGTGRHAPAVELGGVECLGGGMVDDDAVAAGDVREPGGQVDRRAEDVAEAAEHRAGGQADPDGRHL